MTDQANEQFCETELLAALTDISNMCVGEQAMNVKLDSQAIGEMIYEVTGLNNPELNELVKNRMRESEKPMDTRPHTTCPKCNKTSYSLGDIENAWCRDCGDYRKSQLHVEYFKGLVDKRVETLGTDNVRVEIHVINRSNPDMYRMAVLAFKNKDSGEWERQIGYYATGHYPDFSEFFGEDYKPAYVKGISGTLICYWTPKYVNSFL